MAGGQDEDFCKRSQKALSARVTRRRRNTKQRRVMGKEPAIGKKDKKIITACPHTDMNFYAKGMCKNCYHKKGRDKLADKCPHIDSANYAHGVCKRCYLSEYHRQRRA